MLDSRTLLKDPSLVSGLLVARGVEAMDIDLAMTALARSREALRTLEEARVQIKRRGKELSVTVREGASGAEDFRTELRCERGRLGLLEEAHQQAERESRSLLLALPNLPAADAPAGLDDAQNVLLRQCEAASDPVGPTHQHWDTAATLNWSDPGRAARMSGAGFPVLRGDGARLLRALISFGLDLHRPVYEELLMPQFVREEAMLGSGHLPRFEDGVYRLADLDLYAVPTGEVPLTALHQDELFDQADLPVLTMLHTACFRKEAGSAGADSRGMQRLHEYHQIELSRIVTPETSGEHLRALLADAERALRALGLPYRVLDVCAGRLPFAAARAYRLDVYAMGLKRWLPVSTVSLFTDFQARRSRIRTRTDAGNVFVHTLNASAVAASRLWAVLIENCRQDDGSIRIPLCLQPYMGKDRAVVGRAME
ncbi:serine--tRNA ligase [Streptomyces sp. H34-S4]|uniref:serine--tRNA ligase n=1 Tax=Streptomyces sp. H34-S4 TaxID=2996463 RepID=UPI00226D5CA6|nr:serine--tRNA ligase [Streptomyces sp. H34-S4]MCY0933938.1 serine--tRNA ligase [Streptomyces sp. H34-S4]